ncbi:MAG: ATP synthase F0 subunit B [Candidatus Aminicenantes bacterium]|nr:ATP synthase F0 subunit B [Candidatus Aminicenantes bacterium]
MNMLNLDYSIIFVIILIWLLMNILNKVYYKPVGKLIQEREQKIEKDSRKMESTTKGVEEKTRHIEKVLSDSKKESMRIREALIQKGEAVREQMIIEARERSKSLLKRKMEELEQELVKAEEQLTQEIDLFSDKIKDKFL